MHVRVPYLRRLEVFPRGGNELVVGEARRQRRAAWIPEALLGPVTPEGRARGRCAGADET